MIQLRFVIRRLCDTSSCVLLLLIFMRCQLIRAKFHYGFLFHLFGICDPFRSLLIFLVIDILLGAQFTLILLDAFFVYYLFLFN